MDNLNIKDEILSYCQACGSEVSDLDTTSEMLEMFKDLTRIEVSFRSFLLITDNKCEL